MSNNPIRNNDPTGHMQESDGNSVKGSNCSGIFAKYCNKGKPKSKAELIAMRPCPNCDYSDRHKTQVFHIPYTQSINTGAPVNSFDINGDYPDSTNIPYIPGVSPGINGPIASNPCMGGSTATSAIAFATCGASLVASIVPQKGSTLAPNPNFTVTFNIDYIESSMGNTIAISNMQYANRGATASLLSVEINGNTAFTGSPSYMPSDGSYYPIPGTTGAYDGNNPLSVNLNIFVTLPTSQGAIGAPKPLKIILPSLPEMKNPD